MVAEAFVPCGTSAPSLGAQSGELEFVAEGFGSRCSCDLTRFATPMFKTILATWLLLTVLLLSVGLGHESFEDHDHIDPPEVRLVQMVLRRDSAHHLPHLIAVSASS